MQKWSRSPSATSSSATVPSASACTPSGASSGSTASASRAAGRIPGGEQHLHHLSPRGGPAALGPCAHRVGLGRREERLGGRRGIDVQRLDQPLAMQHRQALEDCEVWPLHRVQQLLHAPRRLQPGEHLAGERRHRPQPGAGGLHPARADEGQAVEEAAALVELACALEQQLVRPPGDARLGRGRPGLEGEGPLRPSEEPVERLLSQGRAAARVDRAALDQIHLPALGPSAEGDPPGAAGRR